MTHDQSHNVGKVQHPLQNIAEWRKGCSCTIGGHPSQCEPCTDGLIKGIEEWFRQQVPQVVQSKGVFVDAGALQMVLNALERDALEGKQARAEMRLELMRTISTQQGMDAQELLAALGDLSFACFGGIGTKAPDAATYNRTFAVLQKHRDAAQAKQGGTANG